MTDARDDVRTALAPRRRTCPECGHVTEGPGRTCPACGAEFVRRDRGRPGRPGGRAIALGLLALLVVTVVSVLIVRGLRDDAETQAALDTARQERLVAAERRRLEAEAGAKFASVTVPDPGAGLAGERRRLVRRAEALISADARTRVARGAMRGPVKETSCVTYPPTQARRDLEADPAATRRRYECVVLRRRFALPELQGKRRTGILGTPFWAVVDDEAGRVAWCRISPRAGEAGGAPLATVKVPAACTEPG